MTLIGLGLKSHRTGIIALSLLGGITGALNAAAFIQLAGTTPAERAAFGQEMTVLGKQLAYLLPDPVQLDTLAGYLTWRAFGFLGLIFAIWAILASSGIGRGEEEKGLTEHWLSAGVSRARWLLTRFATFAVAATIAIVATFGATEIAAMAYDEALPPTQLTLQAIVLLGVTLASFGIGLFVAQLVLTRRTAGAIGAVIVVALYELNAAGRAGMDLGPFDDLSPFALASRSTPLLAGRAFDIGATALLFAVAATLLVASLLSFERRDVGGPLLRSRVGTASSSTMRPAGDPLLRVPVLAMVDQQRWWLVGWTLGLAALAYFLTSLARTIVDSMRAIPSFAVFFERLGVSAYSDFIGVLWFGTGLFVLSALTIAQVNGWATDDAEGRLEAMLASGASRQRIVIERIAALLVIVAVVIAVSSTLVFFAARSFDITLPGDRTVLATVLVLPVVFAFAGIGAAIVGWRPRVAVVLLGAVAILSYFIQQFAALFSWPEWLRHLSLFELYGTPMTKDDWGGIVALVAIGVAGTALALLSMRRRDVGT